MGKTLAEKLWDSHVVRSARRRAGPALHRHAPRARGHQSRRRSTGCAWPAAPVRRPDLTLATEDHNIPTDDIDRPIADPSQPHPDRDAARATAPSSASGCYPMGDADQGIVHVIGPQLGHHPARHDDRLRRLATPRRTARSARSRSASAPARSSTCSRPRRCRWTGRRRWPSPSTATLPDGVTPKDVILAVIAQDRHRRRPGLHGRVPRQRHSSRCPWKAG